MAPCTGTRCAPKVPALAAPLDVQRTPYGDSLHMVGSATDPTCGGSVTARTVVDEGKKSSTIGIEPIA